MTNINLNEGVVVVPGALLISNKSVDLSVINQINQIQIQYNAKSPDQIKIAFSVDNKQSWLVWDKTTSSWKTIDLDPTQFMTIEDVESLDPTVFDQLKQKGHKLDIAIYLQATDLENVSFPFKVSVQEFTINVTNTRNRNRTVTFKIPKPPFNTFIIVQSETGETPKWQIWNDFVWIQDSFNAKETKTYRILQSEQSNATNDLLSTIDTSNTCDIFKDGSSKVLLQFDNSISDRCNNVTITSYGRVSYGRGKFKNACYFNGRTYLRMTPPVTKLPFTISCWIKTRQRSSGSAGWHHPTLIGFATAYPESNDFGIEIHNGYIHVFSGFGVEDYYTTNKYVADNKWHHIVVVFDTNEYRIYCDKTLVAKRSQSSNSVANVSFWSIGALYDFGSTLMHDSFFNGYMDQLRIFNKALTEDEISILYEEKIQGIQESDGVQIDSLVFKSNDTPKDYVVYLPFDNSVEDQTNHTTVQPVGQNIEFVDGVFGKAIHLRDRSYLKITEPFTKLPMSISCWIRTKQKQNGTYPWCSPTIIGFSTRGGSSRDFGIELTNGYMHIFSGLGGNQTDYHYTDSQMIADDEWHHICVVFDPGQNIILYVDGVRKDTGLKCNLDSLAKVPFWTIGCIYDYERNACMPTSYFDGYIDDLRIYNRALTDKEVKVLANKQPYKIRIENPNSSSLLAYLLLDLKPIDYDGKIHWDMTLPTHHNIVFASSTTEKVYTWDSTNNTFTTNLQNVLTLDQIQDKLSMKQLYDFKIDKIEIVCDFEPSNYAEIHDILLNAYTSAPIIHDISLQVSFGGEWHWVNIDGKSFDVYEQGDSAIVISNKSGSSKLLRLNIIA